MASIFYLDYENGNDATTATPLGWWSVAFTGGTGPAPVADETVTGATSGSTAKITVITISSGSWAGNDAAGTMYFYGKSAAFQSEQVNCAGGGHFHIAADFTYCAWKTITSGATAARIAPGDIIRIAKSPAPTALAGTTATWTNLSKTVTLNAAETATIENCENDWTAVNATSSAKLAVATDAKEGSYCVKIIEDGTPGANEVQAYYDIYTHDTTAHDLSAYQKISFWIKNEVAITANQWEINLCSNADGTGDVDTFAIPAIPSTGQWIPLTIARTGGGNLGSAIKSINISNGSGTPTASKYIYLDNIIACTTNGLNLQSLISKSNLEQGGTEAFYTIQSIVGTAVILDGQANSKSNSSWYYCGVTETVNTYKRETTKIDLSSAYNTSINQVQDSGTYGNNIQFQAGYDKTTNGQTGETFFDGLNGNGYGIYLSTKSFISLNYFNFYRFYYGVGFSSSSNNNIINLNQGGGNENVIYCVASFNNIIENVNNVQHNNFVFYFTNSTFNQIINLSSGGANSRIINFSNSIFNTIESIVCPTNGWGDYIYFISMSSNNIIKDASIQGTINDEYGKNYFNNLTILNTLSLSSFISFANPGIFINKLGGNYSAIYTDGGNIISQASTLTNGSETEWKFTTETNTNRQLNYPLKLTIAKIAVVANKEVTVTCYFKKGHATDIGARLVFPAQLGEVEHYATCPNDTNENNLSIAFTPTEAGVCEIEAWAYYIAGHSTVIVDAITIDQAA